MTSLTHTDDRTIADLDALVEETYLLWDEEWVGFSWRNYTHEHMRRVRGLSTTLADAEGADKRLVAYAATLHDVTKSYDGEILTGPDGKRVLDENGFWRNATLPPARRNSVTDIYDRLGLSGTVHHASGGQVARVLLEARGIDADLINGIETAILEHLIANPDSTLAGRCLYDADTIDANIGMPAFYRNIQISLRNQDVQYSKRGEHFPSWLEENLADFLQGYLRERIPTWIESKAQDFVPKLMTGAGKAVATARLDRLRSTVQMLIDELDDLDRARRQGAMAIVASFMARRKNPKLVAELDAVATELGSHALAGPAATLLGYLHLEVAGHA